MATLRTLTASRMSSFSINDICKLRMYSSFRMDILNRIARQAPQIRFFTLSHFGFGLG